MDETKENVEGEGKRWRNFKMENVRASSENRYHGKTKTAGAFESLLAPRDSGKLSLFQLCMIYIEM